MFVSPSRATGDSPAALAAGAGAAAAIRSSNAERLLLLADKWDVTALKAAVERYVLHAWHTRGGAPVTRPRPAADAALLLASNVASDLGAIRARRDVTTSGAAADVYGRGAAGQRLRLEELPQQLKWLQLASRTGLRALFDAISDGVALQHDSRAIPGHSLAIVGPLSREEARGSIEGLALSDARALLAKLLLR